MPEQGSTQSNPSSSSQGAPASAQPNAAAAASASTPPARPEGLADSYWNVEKGGLQVEPLLKDFNSLRADKAQSDLRRASLPVKPEDYKAELPNGFQLPEEFKDYKLDANDPRLPAARALAHELGIDQGGFSRLLGIQMQYDIETAKGAVTKRDAEIAKLGPNGTARIDAVTTWAEARNGGKPSALVAALTSSAALEEFENIIKGFSSQGAAPFNGSHREQRQPEGKIEGYENMTFEQRRAAQMNRQPAA